MLLKKGDKKVNVRHLQDKLNIEVDGHFGPLTEKAVIKYQLSNGLSVTGMVDSDMWVLLFNKPYSEDLGIDEDTDISSDYFTTNYDQLIHKHYLSEGQYIKVQSKMNIYFYTILQEAIILTEQ